MNLLELRTQLVKSSGRYDLVNTTTYADNGIDFHIKAGQRWLNNKSAIPRAFSHSSDTLTTGNYVYDVANKFKELSSVTVDNGVDSAWALTYKSLTELKTLYNIGTVPLYYTNVSQSALESANTRTLEEFINLSWTSSEDDHNDYSGIIIAPVPQVDYTITIAGKFFPSELINDTDSNFWSNEYPELLILAALRALALFVGDFNKVKFFEEVIRTETGVPFRNLTPDNN